MIIRKIIQWINFKLEILSSIFGFLNEIKWIIKKSIIKNKGSLCSKIKPEISLNLDLNLASELILEDKKHLDNNPIPITKNEIFNLLKEIK